MLSVWSRKNRFWFSNAENFQLQNTINKSSFLIRENSSGKEFGRHITKPESSNLVTTNFEIFFWKPFSSSIRLFYHSQFLTLLRPIDISSTDAFHHSVNVGAHSNCWQIRTATTAMSAKHRLSFLIETELFFNLSTFIQVLFVPSNLDARKSYI
jgi:hypothetical protein